MTPDHETPTAPLPADGPKAPIPGRKQWPLWVLGGAVVGVVAGMNIADDARHGFYLGGFVGVITESVIIVLVNSLPGGARGGPIMAMAAVAAGLGIGALGGILVPMGQHSEISQAQWFGRSVLLGGGIGALDRVFVWFSFPYGEGISAPPPSPVEGQEPIENDHSAPE